MKEVNKSLFHLAVPLFPKDRFGALVYGTLQGNHPGKVFLDNPQKPSIGLVCTRIGYYFLAGQPDTPLLDLGLYDLFTNDLIPQQIKDTRDHQALIFYDPIGWKDSLMKIFHNLHPMPIFIQKKRLFYPPGAEKQLQDWTKAAPEGMPLVPISDELLAKCPEKETFARLFWGSTESFSQNSLGCYLMDGNVIASSCEAVFIGAQEAEISIETAVPYRRRGLARLVASAFIRSCLDQGLKPVWGCWPDNLASLQLARSLGFRDDCDQNVCLIEF